MGSHLRMKAHINIFSFSVSFLLAIFSARSSSYLMQGKSAYADKRNGGAEPCSRGTVINEPRNLINRRIEGIWFMDYTTARIFTPSLYKNVEFDNMTQTQLEIFQTNIANHKIVIEKTSLEAAEVRRVCQLALNYDIFMVLSMTGYWYGFKGFHGTSKYILTQVLGNPMMVNIADVRDTRNVMMLLGENAARAEDVLWIDDGESKYVLQREGWTDNLAVRNTYVYKKKVD